jgi:hypothetical protein
MTNGAIMKEHVVPGGPVEYVLTGITVVPDGIMVTAVDPDASNAETEFFFRLDTLRPSALAAAAAGFAERAAADAAIVERAAKL